MTTMVTVSSVHYLAPSGVGVALVLLLAKRFRHFP